MNVLDLFSGVGGFSLGLERAGYRTVAFCESEPFCREWLAQQWPGVPCFDDVRTLRADAVGSVQLICGGFPCQDISTAGKGAGIDGERSGLWAEMYRLVRELRPDWVLAENVPALRTRGADRVLGDLEAAGYSCWPLVVGADDIGAPHRRKRVWIVAHRNGDRVRKQPGWRFGTSWEDSAEPERGSAMAHRNGANVVNTDGARRETPVSGSTQHEWIEPVAGCGDVAKPACELHERSRTHAGEARSAESANRGSLADAERKRRQEPGRSEPRPLADVAPIAWPAGRGQPQHEWEPPRVIARSELVLGGGFDGLPARVGSAHNRVRLKALGNSIVPQIAEVIGRSIMTVERVV